MYTLLWGPARYMNFLKVLVPDQGSESCLDPGLCYSGVGVCVCDAMVRDKEVTLVVQICYFAHQVILYKDDRSAFLLRSLCIHWAGH